jgi:hypothetical protein
VLQKKSDRPVSELNDAEEADAAEEAESAAWRTDCYYVVHFGFSSYLIDILSYYMHVYIEGKLQQHYKYVIFVIKWS